MSKKILLIAPKDSYLLGSPPLGVGYLISYSNKVGKNEVYFHDENFINENELNSVLTKKINEIKPDFIGITFPSSAIYRVVNILETVKRDFPSIVCFAGGYHPTSEPEATLRVIPDLDFIILDQGEYAFANIDDNWKQLICVGYIDDEGGYVQNKVENTIDGIDNIPFIDRTIYDKRYFEPTYGAISGIYGKVATIMSSRGCPYRCSFCSIELLQKKVEFHGTDYVLGEIENILSTVGDIDYLYFLDVMFLAKWSRVEELCTALIKSKVLGKVKWATTIAANVTTYEKIKLMKEAGCFYVSFGLESNSERSLSLMNKVAKPKHNEKAVSVCEKLGVLTNSAFLVGIPGEEIEDLYETLKFVKKHHIFSTGVNIMKPLPGSPYYYDFIKKGLIEKNIQSWNDISSIHHYSGFFNEKIDEKTYFEFIEEFNKAVRVKNMLQKYKVNFKNILKYKFFK